MFSRVKIVKNALVAWLESSPDHAYTGLRGEGKRKKGGKDRLERDKGEWREGRPKRTEEEGKGGCGHRLTRKKHCSNMLQV